MWSFTEGKLQTSLLRGKLLPSRHKSEVYALTYTVLVALSLYFTSSFLSSSWCSQHLKTTSRYQDHECSFNIQLIYTGNLMPTSFFLPLKMLLFTSLDSAELLAKCYILSRCPVTCDSRIFSLAVLKTLLSQTTNPLSPSSSTGGSSLPSSGFSLSSS